MKYILTNGSYYVQCGANNKICKTLSKENATKFTQKETADFLLGRAPTKLKGFYIDEQKDFNGDQSKSQRRQFTQEERKIIYAKTKGRCALCGKFIHYADFTIDHIQPLSKGGNNDLANLQATCMVCNRIKQDILPQDFMAKISEILVFQMRKNFDKKIWMRLRYVHRSKTVKKWLLL